MRRLKWLEKAAEYVITTALGDKAALEPNAVLVDNEDLVASPTVENLLAHMNAGWSDLRLAITAGFSSS